jgi:hypothetical protein
MLAFAVLLLAALSRFFPHMLHGVGLNITAVGAGLLFFGSRRPRREMWIAVALMAATDFILTRYVYGFSFQIGGYLLTWAWYAGVVVLGSSLLRKVTALRVAAGVVTSATSFFLLSNFAVWAGGMYGYTVHGLGLCYASALPFYGNDLASTGLVAGALFGLPVLAAKLTEAFQASGHAA